MRSKSLTHDSDAGFGGFVTTAKYSLFFIIKKVRTF